MGSLSGTLLLAQSALTANQAAIDITAGNTANANTAGYTRETAAWREMDSVTLGGGVSSGAGVQVTTASQRDRVLQQRVDQQYQEKQQTETRLSALTDVQSVISTTGSAGSGDISTAINSFFTAASALATNPTDGPTRASVLAAAQALASSFNGAATQLGQQSGALSAKVSDTVTQVNALTAQIASLNTQIQSEDPTTDAGTLEDALQQAIYQLSQYVGLNQITTEKNGLTLTTTGGGTLVSGGTAYALTTATVAGATDVFSGATGTAQDVTAGTTGGVLGGLLTARDGDIPQAMSLLDALAYRLGTQLNAVNAAGLDANGNAGGAIFNLPVSASAADPAGSAAGISVALTSASGIAAAGAGQGVGGNANALAAVQGAIVANGETATGFYAMLVATVGESVAAATSDNTSQKAALAQLTSQNAALSGVSLDEEASNLTQYERSYQAASKVFSIVDTLMASVLNLGEQATVS